MGFCTWFLFTIIFALLEQQKSMKNKLEGSINYIRSLPKNNDFIKNLNDLADRAEKALDAWQDYEKSKFI
jgi:hypothetical protein